MIRKQAVRGGDKRVAAGLIAATLLAVAIGASLVLARAPESRSAVEAKQLMQEVLAGEPDKEVNAQIYNFPPGASVPWHIHPDAHEFDYLLEGTLTLEVAGEAPRTLKAGEAVYVRPNVVHRGLNLGSEPVKIFVLRVKPKDKPLTTEVPAP
jgi:quercetin dioxygenase-like cupin family protein